MAFVNAYLTEEEKKMMEEAKIHDPRYPVSLNRFLTPEKWTIDKERDIALIYCGELDREEYYKKVFVLLLGKPDINASISFTLINRSFDYEKEVGLKNKYNVNLIEKWNVIDKKISNALIPQINEIELFENLVSALTAYGVNGKPNIVQNVKAFLEVGGEIIS